MRVVITGGAGFIGQATIAAVLDHGHTATTFDHPLDVCRPGDVQVGIPVGTDAVIHLAGVLGTAELFDNPHLAVDVNVHGTLTVLERCAEIGAGYVGITMPPAFPSIYTATKLCADRLASAFHLAHGVPVSRVRAFNAYGPGQKHGPSHPQKIIPTFATLAWAGEPIPVWGDGEQTVDLIHAGDVGRMLADALRFGDDQVFDAGTGYPYTVNEIAEFVIDYVSKRTGERSEVKHLPMRLGEQPTKIVAEGAGWDLLSWRPEFSREALVDTIEWYNPDNPEDGR
ncbi:MAG TPA: NAD(P)-dependent oxidoreductase [Kofleriaceae bacterium]